MTPKPNLDDEIFYEQAVAELRRGERREGLWAKALTEALNDTDIAQSLYMKWRVAQLTDDASKKAQSTHKSPQSRRQRSAPTKKGRSPAVPVVLWVLVSWFAYDGFLTDDPEMLEHVTFNRVMTLFMGIAAMASTYRFARRTRSANHSLPPNELPKKDIE
jgi:hypothetical protein